MQKWPDPEGADAALALFGLEKAACEVAYEAENRLHLAAGALARLVWIIEWKPKRFSDLGGE